MKSPFRLQLPILVLGIVISVVPVQAQTFSVLHSFTGLLDGASPYAGLTLDAAGNLYGTTTNAGTVFKMAHKSSGWTLQTLYVFKTSEFDQDGADPDAPLTIQNGIVYGTTSDGGSLGCGLGGSLGCGTVFRLRPQARVCPSAPCEWTETILYRFAGYLDGGNPTPGGLVFDHAGNMYGVTQDGGDLNCNCGTVYQVTQDGFETPIYQLLGGTDPESSSAGVTFDTAGDLLGTSSFGGSDNGGTVFQLAQGSWAESVVYNFQNGSGGYRPVAGLIPDGSGGFYGSTLGGGVNGGGTVYDLSPTGLGWIYSVLYSFAGANGGPEYNLAMDSTGNLYGTLPARSGLFGYGKIFKLTHSNGNWIYSSLHDFTGGSDGADPDGSPVVDGAGKIYGTASAGGTPSNNCPYGCGTVWEITP